MLILDEIKTLKGNMLATLGIQSLVLIELLQPNLPFLC